MTGKIEGKFVTVLIPLSISFIILICHPVIKASNSAQTTVALDGLTISYYSGTGLITVKHKTIKDIQYWMRLKSENKMGLLIQVNDSEFNYSLQFLEEDQEWPTGETLKDEVYKSKSITRLPEWVICVVRKEKGM